MCPHERKLRLIMTTLDRYAKDFPNPELAVTLLSIYKKRTGFSNYKLAKQLEVDITQVKRWFRRKHIPSINSSIKIMNFLENRQ